MEEDLSKKRLTLRHLAELGFFLSRSNFFHFWKAPASSLKANCEGLTILAHAHKHTLIHICVVNWWCNLLMDCALQCSVNLAMLWNIDVSLMADVQLRWTGKSESAPLPHSHHSLLPSVYLFIHSCIHLFLRRKKSLEDQGRTDRHVTVSLFIAPCLYLMGQKGSANS